MDLLDIYIWFLIFSILPFIITYANIWFFYKPHYTKKLMLRIVMSLMVFFVPFGWIIYWIIKNKVK
jgi:hypothetical protein